MFDMLLISVLLVSGYLGPQVLRQLGPGQRLYGYMLLADVGLAIYALAARRQETVDPAANVLGAVAIGAAVCLVFVPPFLRDLARRALASNRPRIAKWLAEFRELLQPGMGAREEAEFIDMLIATRTGREDQTIERLREVRTELDDPLARRRIDERIVLTYLYARRWKDAIEHYEAHLSAMDGPTSTQLLVEMVRAYGEEGDLDAAAELMEVLESSSLAEEPLFAALINRARLMFLAFVGRTAAVEGLIGAGGPLATMPAAARSFWSGLARMHAGDKAGARGRLEEAARLAGSDPRARAYTEQVITVLDQDMEVGPLRVPGRVAELADQVTERVQSAASRPKTNAPVLRGVRWRMVPATLSLVVLNLAAAVWAWFLFRAPGDIGALVASGANVKLATASGEYWRLTSSMFLHVGWAHLLLNVYSLWVLGRLVEQFLGSTRFFAVAILSGIGGSVASTFLGGPATSAGASGVAFGLLGAAIYELWVHKEAYTHTWRRALLGNLVFVTGAMVLIAMVYTAIDQAAHLGGLAAGVLMTALLSPKSRVGGSLAVRGAAVLFAVLAATAVAYGAWGMTTQRYEQTLAAMPLTERTVGDVSFVAPASWVDAEGGVLLDPAVPSMLHIGIADHEGSLDEALSQVVDEVLHGGAKDKGFERAILAETTRMKLPAPWRSDELVATEDGPGGRHRFRVVVFAKPASAGKVWYGALYCPDVLVDDFAPTFRRILDSVRVPR